MSPRTLKSVATCSLSCPCLSCKIRKNTGIRDLSDSHPDNLWQTRLRTVKTPQLDPLQSTNHANSQQKTVHPHYVSLYGVWSSKLSQLIVSLSLYLWISPSWKTENTIPRENFSDSPALSRCTVTVVHLKITLELFKWSYIQCVSVPELMTQRVGLECRFNVSGILPSCTTEIVHRHSVAFRCT